MFRKEAAVFVLWVMGEQRVANESTCRGAAVYRIKNGKEGMDDGGWRRIDGG